MDVDMTSEMSLGLEIVWVIAEITGADPGAMTPISTVIDPEALDTLLSADSIEHLQVTFTYEGWSVKITADGEITLSEPEEVIEEPVRGLDAGGRGDVR